MPSNEVTLSKRRLSGIVLTTQAEVAANVLESMLVIDAQAGYNIKYGDRKQLEKALKVLERINETLELVE